jgi:hypothetical protein
MLLILISIKSFNQEGKKYEYIEIDFKDEQGKQYDFIETNYKDDGLVLSKKDIHIDNYNGTIDIYFYAKNFHFLSLPDKFVDNRYHNDTILIWSYKGDKMQQSSKSFIYDSISRLVLFSYSGCPVCSQSKYDYKVEYDFKDNPVIINNLNGNDRYEIIYDKKGEVKELKSYFLNKLYQKIKLK